MSQHVYASEGTWERLCEEVQLVLAYKKEGELSFEALRLLFEAENPPANPPQNEVLIQNDVIQISSDTEDGKEGNQDVVDLVGDDDSHLSSLHSSESSSLNTTNSFWNELTWMNHATSSDQSWPPKDGASLLCGNDVQHDVDKGKDKKHVGSSSRKGGSSKTSSSPSWSPFKT